MLNRPDDALLTVGRARERNLNNDPLLLVPYFVAFLKGTDDEIRRTAEEARKDRSTKTSSRIWRRSPWLAPAACKMRDGWPRSGRGRAAVGSTRAAGLFEAARAVWEAFYGNAAAARQSAAKALELERGPRSELCRGVRASPRR